MAAMVASFRVSDAYRPTGDQPDAIAALSESIGRGDRFQTLLGATGTGKTATMAWIAEQVQKPTLVIAHNKTLAAQLCNEFREFLPGSAVEYFVSYYDYYQPEAYVPQADLYIEKDASINDDIDRLRHAATAALLARQDVLIVASVSCIYGIGSPEAYEEKTVALGVGQEIDRDVMLRKLVDIQYARNDSILGRGRFRVRGDVVEVQPAHMESAYRISFFGDEVEQVTHFDPLSGEIYARLEHLAIFPATQYVTSRDTIERSVGEIKHELEEQVKLFESQGKLLEAHRIRQRTEYDLEMLQELGYCNGIENYSRILDGREPGTPPHTLLDFFGEDFVVMIDESHQTVPQIGGMYEGDRSRKETLVEHGFRLPSALDNRPLRFDEFLERAPQLLFVSATPGAVRASQLDEHRRADHPPDRRRRPRGRAAPDEEPDRRPPQRDPAPRGGGRARARHDADEEDGRGPDRLPARVGRAHALPPLRGRHARPHQDHPRAAPGRVRRARRRQPPARGARPARGLARGHPRRRQGGLPPRPDGADPDDRARGAERQRQGRHVRGQDDRGDQGRDRRDDAPARHPAPLQRGARDHAGVDRQGRLRHRRVPLARVGPARARQRRRRGQRQVEGMSNEELEKLVVTLEEEMFAAAEELRFEYAAKLRDEIKDLRRELQATAEPAA